MQNRYFRLYDTVFDNTTHIIKEINGLYPVLKRHRFVSNNRYT